MITSSSRNARNELDDGDDTDPLELTKKKELLEEERRKFTEAGVRLGQERRQLEVSFTSNFSPVPMSVQVERQSFLEEQRKADVEAMLALLPPTPLGSNSITPLDSLRTSPFARTSSWGAHRSISPSPLSPSHPKNRTPKPYPAGRRRSTKTPLSRLVLEKAVRQKGRETATALEQERLGVLGDGGRRGNAAKKDSLKSSIRGVTSLKPGTGPLAASTGSGVKKDLSKADGIGPKTAARGSKIWR